MRRSGALALAVIISLSAITPALARAPWKSKIDRLVSGRAMGVAVWRRGRPLYESGAKLRRTPASNQKLLASMALLDALGARHRFPTIAAARSWEDGVVAGHLWILGRGDPAVAGRGVFARSLPFRATRLGKLARAIARAGVHTITGGVRGSASYFARDWGARGWRSYYRSRYIPLPTALTFQGNTHRWRHITDPERRLAVKLTGKLEALGVRVGSRPGWGYPPRGLDPLAAVRSRALAVLLRHQNRSSSNFFAEVLGKALSVASGRRPGSIAGGARAISRWAARRGVAVTARDASGLSYDNRISARGVVRLLRAAKAAPWGLALRRSLAGAGQGTLEGRLAGVRLRAKTGTLIGVSALSGWVRQRRMRAWAEFSILSRGMPKHTAVALEDRIVRIVSRLGRRRSAGPRDVEPSLSEIAARALWFAGLVAPGPIAVEEAGPAVGG